MTKNRAEDELLLIDFLLGLGDAGTRQEVTRRLGRDEAFMALHEDLRHTFQALQMLPTHEAPEGLVDDTMRRIRRERAAQLRAIQMELGHGAHRAVFSLRELAAVAVAVILLAFIFVPSVQKARHGAILGQCASNAGQIGTALLTYANANDGCLPNAADAARRWLPDDGERAASNSVSLFKLVKNGFTSAEPFQCPGVWGGEQAAFRLDAAAEDFPSSRYVNYSYQHALGPRAMSRVTKELAAVSASMAILADQTPVFRDGRFLPERVSAQASDNHGGTGQNVLYLDVHVDWKENANAGVSDNNIYLVDGVLDYRGDETPAAPTDTFLLPAFSGEDLSRAR